MTCTKCHGFVMHDYDELRCLNCGARPLQVIRPAPVDPTDPAQRCACGKANKMPRRTICKYCLYDRSKLAQDRKKRMPLKERTWSAVNH